MARRASILAIVAICIAAGYLVGRSFWLRTSPSGPPPEAQAVSELAAPSQLPSFSLKDISGTERSIGEWSAQAMIINFWATWCAPCRKEMPLLEQVHQARGGKGVAVVGIAIDDADPVRTFIAETGISYPILVGQDDAMKAAEAFGPEFVGLPLTAVTAPGGAILKLHVGELHPQDLDRILDVIDRLAAGSITLAEARSLLASA